VRSIAYPHGRRQYDELTLQVTGIALASEFLDDLGGH
jgi:hypothetical protein